MYQPPVNNARSYLFVPANRPDFIAKVHLKGADIVILDLEDSIPQDQKQSARKQLAEAILQLTEQQQTIAVRINADLENLCSDLAAVDLTRVKCLLLPMTEDASVIRFIEKHLNQLEQRQGCDEGSTALVVMIETCRGVANMREIAQATPRIIALSLGSEDLSSELGVEPSPESLTGVCRQMVLAAKEAGIDALGFPGSIGEFSDLEKLNQMLNSARNMGFSGSLCIHPAQVAAVNDIFVYSEQQQRWAARVIDALQQAEQQGLGTCKLDGRMLDAPVAALARQILARSEMNNNTSTL